MVLPLVIVTIFAVFSFVSLGMLLWRDGYINKIFAKLGLQERQTKMNWTAFSWKSMLEKMNCKADFVFFGDSIVRGGDFQKCFPDKKIVNLGCSGDTLSALCERCGMIKILNPEKIFVLGGINGLTNKNVEMSIKTYARLLNKIKQENPNSEIYLHSVLPLSPRKEKKICKNTTIKHFNQKLRMLANENNVLFVDLFPLYEKDGALNPELTIDGIHLYPYGYEKWESLLKTHIMDDELFCKKNDPK